MIKLPKPDDKIPSNNPLQYKPAPRFPWHTPAPVVNNPAHNIVSVILPKLRGRALHTSRLTIGTLIVCCKSFEK